MYRVSRASIVTKEEKAAQKIAQIMTDFTIDLEKVGYHLARSTSYLLFRRAVEVLEAAQYQLDTVEQNRVQYKHDNRR